MVGAIVLLAVMGLLLGLGLGIAGRIFRVEGDPLVEEVESLMPGTQCGQCGFAGCTPAAEAIVNGSADITCCPPGGKALVQTLAEKLNIEINLDNLSDDIVYANINREQCTGCMRCSRVCPTDAIIGANKQIHSVFTHACTSCNACVDACPEDCIDMQPELVTLDTWHWPKPAAA